MIRMSEKNLRSQISARMEWRFYKAEFLTDFRVKRSGRLRHSESGWSPPRLGFRVATHFGKRFQLYNNRCLDVMEASHRARAHRWSLSALPL